MRKLCSLILTIALLFSLSVPAFASSYVPEIQDSTNSMQLSDGSYLISEDLANGDAKFSIIKNGEIIAESYLNRSSAYITSTDTRLSAEKQVHNVNVAVANSNVTSPARAETIPSGFTKRGTITYNFFGGMTYVVGTRSLNIYYDYNYYTGSRYNVNGVYQNIAGLASFLASILVLPASIASSVAAKILTSLGISTGAASLIIPDHYVRCNETEITWLSQIADITDMYATFTGSKFVVTEEGYSSKTYQTGNYWPLSSYTNHDSNFAVKLYWEVLGQDTLEIVSWS